MSHDNEKVTVWCALSIDPVLEPYYFYDPIVTGNSYLCLLHKCLLPMLLEQHANIIFQEDGAPLHYSRAVQDLLNEKLPDLWIGRKGPVNWAAQSSDLPPIDFFFWAYVKDNVFNTRYNSSTFKAWNDIKNSKHTHGYASKCMANHENPLFCCSKRK